MFAEVEETGRDEDRFWAAAHLVSHSGTCILERFFSVLSTQKLIVRGALIELDHKNGTKQIA